MLHDLLEREESLKATALRAANAGDWTTVVANARALGKRLVEKAVKKI